MADIPLGRAVLKVTTDKSDYDAGIKDIKKGGKDLEKSFEDVGRAVGRMVSFDVLSGMAADAVAATSAVTDMAERMGLSVEAVQEFQFAAQQTGASITDVGTAIGVMSKKLESGAAEKSLEKIGLNIDAIKKMAPDQAFQAIAEKIAQIEDPMQRSAVAMDLFGKSGVKLVPMMGDLEGLRQKARDTGAVLSGDLVAAGDRLGDTWDSVNTRLNNLKAQALLPVLGLFEKMPGSMQLVAGAGVGLAGNLKDIGLAVMAVGGPTAAIGMLSGALSSLGFLLTLPAGAVVAAIVGIVAIWKNWDKIGPIVKDVYDTVKTWMLDKLSALWEAMKDALTLTIKSIATMLKVGGILLNPVAGVVTVWKNWDQIADIAQKVYTAVKTWLVDKFAAVIQSIKDKVNAVTGVFKDMYDKVVGSSYVPDLLAGIAREFGRLDGVMVQPARIATDGVNGLFSSMSSTTLGTVGGFLGELGNTFTNKLTEIFGDNGIVKSLISFGMEAVFGENGLLMSILKKGLELAVALAREKASEIGGWLDKILKWLGPLASLFGGGGGGVPAWALNNNAPSLEIAPMAAGGYGRVTRPTLFLAGEGGPEDVAFSGGHQRFGGAESGLYGEMCALRADVSRLLGALPRQLAKANMTALARAQL